MKPQLSGSHRRTYDGIFRHPVARNLGWRDVRSMLGALAEVVEEPNGNLKIAHNGQTLVLHPSLDKNVAEIEDLLAQLKQHHGEVAKRVVGSIVLDETHLTEDQLLAKARDLYAGLAWGTATHSPAARTGSNR